MGLTIPDVAVVVVPAGDAWLIRNCDQHRHPSERDMYIYIYVYVRRSIVVLQLKLTKNSDTYSLYCNYISIKISLYIYIYTSGYWYMIGICKYNQIISNINIYDHCFGGQQAFLHPKLGPPVHSGGGSSNAPCTFHSLERPRSFEEKMDICIRATPGLCPGVACGCSSRFKIAQNNAEKHWLYAVIWGLGFQALGF